MAYIVFVKRTITLVYFDMQDNYPLQKVVLYHGYGACHYDSALAFVRVMLLNGRVDAAVPTVRSASTCGRLSCPHWMSQWIRRTSRRHCGLSSTISWDEPLDRLLTQIIQSHL